MKIHNIAADENCLFQAVCFAAYGSENEHGSLRVDVVHYMQQNKLRICNTFSLTDKEFVQLIAKLATPCVATEHAIYVIFSLLKRKDIVHISFAELQTFSPLNADIEHLPIHRAFYDGLCGGIGHYCSVMDYVEENKVTAEKGNV